MRLSQLLKISVAIAVVLITLTTPGLAATTRIAIVPFQINSEKDYTFLQKGIVQMLTSRLSSDKVVVVDPVSTETTLQSIEGMTGDSLALMAGAKLQADYVVHGSITVLGESVSIDSKMLNVTGTREPFHFFKQTPSMNEVIPQINLLATEINDEVFGRRAPAVATATQPAPTAQQGLPATDSRAHPEKLIQGGITADGTGRALPGHSSPLNPAFIQGVGPHAGKGLFWKSRNYSYLINGMAVGDVNNDGAQEVVVANPDKIIIYQMVQNRMAKLAEVKGPKFTTNLSVDIGDINENGTPEIFVTALTGNKDALASYVLEFENKVFKTVVRKTKHYFRVIQHPHRGAMLLGQKQRAGDPPHNSPIMEMEWKGGDYISTGRLLPPRRVNLLGLAVGDIINDKTEQAVALNASDRLRVLELSGKEMWTSTDYYGGTPLYYAMPGDSPGTTYRSAYYPVRLLAVDLDGDGQIEVIAPQNVDSAKRRLAEQRFFSKSKLVALTWDGLGLTPLWQTRQLSGRIQDIAVADFDNDGEMELLAAVVSKDPILTRKAKSALISFDLNKPDQDASKSEATPE